MTASTTTDGPQSCYPEEIETLREMLTELVHGLPHPAAHIAGTVTNTSRIDALKTAIEALGGAL